MKKYQVARLAVASAAYHIDKPYDYMIPDALVGAVVPGVRVVVPFGRGNRRTEGLVLSVTDGSERSALKCVESILDPAPVLSSEQMKLALWMSERFFCTVFDAVKAMLPSGIWFKEGTQRLRDKTVTLAVLDIPAEEALILTGQKRRKAPQQAAILELLAQLGSASVPEILYLTGAGRGSINRLRDIGAVVFEQQIVFRRPEITVTPADGPIVLNDTQQQAFDALNTLLHHDKAEAALLYGVTGSGKTSVYIRLIDEAIARGYGAIVLVPEIALTPQLIATFSSYFGDQIAVMHSALSLGERYDEWKRVRSGDVRVVVGTRSAVFAPVHHLGLIIIDEEQEHTYKSENSPRYHARDVAKFRAAATNALLLLGSATPSVESMYSARNGKYALLRLDNRYNEQQLPSVVLADMKKELQRGNGGTISSVLLEELKSNIARGEQSILLINRRGASTLIACGECGYTFECPRCSVSTTYHAANRRLMCHYCGYSEPEPAECPECGGRLKYIGAGTQKAEAELQTLLPGVEIVRMDTDTISATKTHEQHLRRFHEQKIPILLGTQMVAKGLDFENVTLVGVLSADQMLYIGDFRAHERAFSLITQVVGRSGRGIKPGRAVIQTLTPKNEVICLAAEQDYDGFYAREIALRQLSGSPPIRNLITLTVSGTDEAAVLTGCVRLKNGLAGYLKGMENTEIFGPAPAGIAKVNNRYRYRISLSCAVTRKVRDTVAHVVRQFFTDKNNRGLHVYADADPYDI